MRPDSLRTRIFLDGGDPRETISIKNTMGFLDGQTTNPSFVAKSPAAKEHLKEQGAFSRGELLTFYRELIREISTVVPQGSVSIEVYADMKTSAQSMLEQAREMNTWVANAHIKFPTTPQGLEAARQALGEGMRVNMTLCFQQQQAAAVYAATKGAAPGDVFLSPFVGRLDDRGKNGMDLIANILKMFEQGDGHVQLLSASLRNQYHLRETLRLGAHILTAKHETLAQWAQEGLPVPGPDVQAEATSLRPIPYEELDLERPWQSYDMSHPETEKGVTMFAADWNALLHESETS